MRNRKPSRLRQGMHLAALLVLTVLLFYVLKLSYDARQADHDLEHSPEAHHQLNQALKQYYNKKPAAD